MGTLEAKFDSLSRCDAVIPASAGCRIRVATGDSRIPGAAQSGTASISPAHIPVVDGAGAFVGNADCTGKACAPVVGDYIAAISAGSRGAGSKAAASTAGCSNRTRGTATR